MKTGTCPVCGSDNIYTNWAMSPANERIWRSYHYDVLTIAQGREARLEQYICGDCGFVQSYVAPDRLNVVRRRWDKPDGVLHITRRNVDVAEVEEAPLQETAYEIEPDIDEPFEVEPFDFEQTEPEDIESSDEPELITQEAPAVVVDDDDTDEDTYDADYADGAYNDNAYEVAYDEVAEQEPAEVRFGHHWEHHRDVNYGEPEYGQSEYVEPEYAEDESDGASYGEEPDTEPPTDDDPEVDESSEQRARPTFVDDYVEMHDTPLPTIEAIVTDSRPPSPPEEPEYIMVRLTDEQWAIIDAILPKARNEARTKYSQREIADGIVYKQVNGISWNQLPDVFPPHRNVYNYWKRWCKAGVWADVMDVLVEGFGMEIDGDPC